MSKTSKSFDVISYSFKKQTKMFVITAWMNKNNLWGNHIRRIIDLPSKNSSIKNCK